MSMITIIRRLVRTCVSNLGAEGCSVIMALVVIVGLTAITVMGP